MDRRTKDFFKKRILYFLLFAIFTGIEAVIAIYVHDAFIRPYVGDLLVVIVLYCAVRCIIPEQYRLMPLWIFLFAAFVECLQYFRLVQALGMEDNAFFRILIGSTFDGKDLVCYGIGCILIGIYEWKCV